QLIHGGREPAVRAPATRDALAALAARGFVAPEDAAALSEAYTLLRTIEHRVQMIDDRQTHVLPSGPALDGVARLHGLEGGADLLALLAPPVARTAAIYASLEPEAPAGLPLDRDRLAEALGDLGFGAHAALAADRVARWRGGTYPALRSAAAQAALEAVLPGLGAALGAAPDPAGAILRLDDMLAGLPSALNLFRLLEAQPALARLLGAILSHAPPLAEALGRRPALLDGLIDASALDPLGSVDALVAQLRPAEPIAYEALLDQLRAGVNERRFALGAQLVAATSDPLDIAAGYARLAEAAIEVAASASVAEFAKRHGHVPGSELVILALGRLGGGLLTHASDLDLVYLFTGDHLAESDGAKPLGAVLYYNRLAQRVSAALSVPTPAGALYEIDTRLRPSGAQGPLVVSVAGFAAYQRHDAWTWEHMALARARPVFGSPPARAAVAAEIAAVLAGDRPARDIVAEARTMRAEIARHKPPAGPLDVKLLPGGLVDLEFAVHVTQLTQRRGFDPDLRRAIAALADQGLVPARLGAAHDFLTRLLVAMRLIAPGGQLPGPASCALLARVLGLSGCDAVVARADAMRHDIAELWHGLERKSDGA
ncbi:MAG: glutamine-synthetase adenylyltransferase, partial [Sphingomonas sp.]|nr:glutamine-synthetase adenylyltransferase [Sphingomonas sp.]